MGGNFSFCIAPEQFRLKDWATEKKKTLSYAEGFPTLAF